MNYSATLFLLLFASSLANAQASEPCPLASTLTIDGNADEWPMKWVQDDEKIFSYNVCADEQFLYVRLMTSEFYTKRKLSAFGLTLWMDPSGKKKTKLGLKFPLGGSEAEERMAAIQSQTVPGASVGEKADFQKKIDRDMITGLEILELIGLSDEPITSTRSGITNGIKVAIGMDEANAYVYEAVIPFRAFRMSRASLKELSIGFETGKYVVPKAKPTKVQPDDPAAEMTPNQRSRMQGYESLMANPKLAYAAKMWTKLTLTQQP